MKPGILTRTLDARIVNVSSLITRVINIDVSTSTMVNNNMSVQVISMDSGFNFGRVFNKPPLKCDIK